mgnify:CR=1 FL=1
MNEEFFYRMRGMSQPLAGKTIVVTRPRAQSARLAAALRARGARVVFAPLIVIVLPRSLRKLDEALRGLSRFEAVVFASANAVDMFFSRAKRIIGKRPAPPLVAAAVGPATAEALRARGWACAVIPEDSRAEGLAASLRLPRGCRVLLPRAERGREALPRLLRAAGARVTPAAAYRTLADKAGLRRLREALDCGAHAVLFASPSAVTSAANRLGRARMRRVFGTVAAVAIGPTTAAALRALGVTPAGVAPRPDADSFASAAARALGARA